MFIRFARLVGLIGLSVVATVFATAATVPVVVLGSRGLNAGAATCFALPRGPANRNPRNG